MMFSRFRLPRASTIFIFSAPNHSPNLHSHCPSINLLSLPLNNHHPVSSNTTILPFSTSAKYGASTHGVGGRIATSSPATVDGEDLPGGLRRELMPRHVAMILDGNKRWAELRGLGSEAGHDAGLKSLLQVMGLCARWSINVASFFLFSSENWRRPKQEIDFVMWRFEKMLLEELENFKRQGLQICSIGDTTTLPNSLQQVLEHTKEATKHNTRTQVVFAISYSGKNDTVQACQSIATKVRDGLIEPKDITDDLIEQELESKITSIPLPDLLIRTSGELRISNFMLWQLAYSEFHFTNTLWPDFGEPEFIEALLSFQSRGRRFGGRS